MGFKRRLGTWLWFIALLLSVALHPLYGQTEDGLLNEGDSRGRLASQLVTPDYSKLRVSPVSLHGGSSLMVISPEQWSPLGQKLTKTLERTHQRFETLLGALPSLNTSVRLMDQESFHLITGAPQWTNALYYRGQIIIPLSQSTRLDHENITRSLRHEYTHAVIHALSEGKCPGWLDEGLAQWAEGPENPALKPALANYLKEHRPVALDMLQGGFTRLETGMVAAAYAQSLIGAQAVIETFGFKRIRNYLISLRESENKSSAFLKNFVMTETDFEKKLDLKLTRWAESYNLMASR